MDVHLSYNILCGLWISSMGGHWHRYFVTTFISIFFIPSVHAYISVSSLWEIDFALKHLTLDPRLDLVNILN